MKLLSKHAISVLQNLPTRRHLVNPGVVDRFYREGLAEVRDLPTGPKATKEQWVCPTEAGIAKMKELGGAQ